MTRSRTSVALLVAALAAGCSADYAGDSKDDFLAAGNDVCKTTGATVMPALKELQGEGLPNRAEVRGFVGDVAVPALQKRVDRLRQLEVPADDRGEIDEIISDTQRAINAIRDNPAQLVDADPFLDANANARAYGLTSCVLAPEP